MRSDEPVSERTDAAKRKANVVFISGNFNIVHPGHLRLLRFAAEQGRKLIVGINPDGSPGVTVPASMRIEALQSINLVSEAILLEEPVEAFIARQKPDIVVKGKEFEERDNPEKAVVEGYGGRLLFGSGETVFSSLSLLQREFRQLDLSTIVKPTDLPLRRGFSINALKSDLAKLAGLRVLVIGDLIVDTYINCEALGMSQEDPTIVVTPIHSRTFVGGAGIVAAHAHGFGADVQFFSVIGEDTEGNFAREQLAEFGVVAHLSIDSTRPTTHKQRYRAHNKTLLRVNQLRQHRISPELATGILNAIDAQLAKTDLLLFADFNYGCLPQPLVDEIVARAQARRVMMAADSQASSQLADVSRFKGMTLLTPTEREARLALQDNDSGLIIIAERLKDAARAKHVVVTLGAEGMLLYVDAGVEYQTDRLPAFNTAPKDVAGAGDSFFTSASMALCAGIDPWRSFYIGSLAAACQASRVGNTPLTAKELITEIDYSHG
jgi:rfaE bifunctional protein kinase chain/domain